MNVPPSIGRFFLGWIEAMVIVGILVFLLRVVVIAPFQVESSAMNPTLLAGDIFFGFKLPFGVRVPGLNSRILTGRLPKKGEVVTFHWPKSDEKIVGRIVGEPGDEVEVRRGEIFLNGTPLTIKESIMPTGIKGKIWKEQLGGITYDVYLDEDSPKALVHEKLLIPPSKFFVITDSRAAQEGLVQLGLVERGRIESRAALIAISVGHRSESDSYLRWDRFFRAIH